MTSILNLLATVAGATLGSLFDPILWAVMIAAAFHVRMRYILPVAALCAVLIECLFWAIEIPELRATMFSVFPLIGRTLAGLLIGSGARLLITRRRRGNSLLPR